jgi:hypothetical protein
MNKTYTVEDVKTVEDMKGAFVAGVDFAKDSWHKILLTVEVVQEEASRRYDPKALRISWWTSGEGAQNIRYNPLTQEFELQGASSLWFWFSPPTFEFSKLSPNQLRIMANLKSNPYETT